MKLSRLEAKQLSAQKGERLLFENVSFSLDAGKAMHIKGPNGSGKTTMLHILAGDQQSLSGHVETYLNNEPLPHIDGVLGLSHIITHKNALKNNLTVLENLEFWTDFFDGDKDRIDEALSTVGLAPMPHILASRLSAGQKKRLMLAKLLTISHPLWLLDEPSVSLDHDGQNLLTALMRAHLDAGGIIIATSHIDLGLEFDQTLELSGGKYMFNDDYLLSRDEQDQLEDGAAIAPFGD